MTPNTTSNSISIAVPHVGEGFDALGLSTTASEVGFVGLSDPPFRFVDVEARHQARFDSWGWAIAISRPPMVTTPFIYAFDQVMTYELREWKADVDVRFSAALFEMQNWVFANDQLVPSLCWGVRQESEKQTSVLPLKKVVEHWRTIIMPSSARIIEGLYSRKDLDRPHERKPWASAAATLARSWLHFYRQPDAPDNRYHRANALMLRRVYMDALIDLELLDYPWSVTDQREELQRAVLDWLRVCMDPQYVWLFQHSNGAWQWDHSSTASQPETIETRERRREGEVQRITDALIALLKKDIAQSRGVDYREFLTAQLELIGRTWYLPRYNIGRGRKAIAHARYSRFIHAPVHVRRPWIARWRAVFAVLIRVGFLGVQRLFASTTIGLSAFVLQGDTWKTLYTLAAQEWWAVVYIVILVGVTFGYMYSGIRNAVGYKSLRQAFTLWFFGELFALALSFTLMDVLGDFVRSSLADSRTNAPPSLGVWNVVVMGVLLAQIGLFVGIFGQLLFGDRASTAPLDPP